jgi:replicative DNA helicase
MSDTLIQFGHSFQKKIIVLLLFNSRFLQTISDIIEPDYFDSGADKWLVKAIKKYYETYKVGPTLDALKIQIDEISADLLKRTVVDNLREAFQLRESTDLNFVEEKIIEFCKNQNLKKAIMESVELLERQDYDGIKTVVDMAMKAGTTKDLGHDYIEGLEERLTTSARDTTPTGWDIIDEIMSGGLGKGELGVLVAPAGVGKTWMLQRIAYHSLCIGKTVLHYTLELNQAYVGLRYDTIFSGIPTNEIKYHKEAVRKALEKAKGKLLIKYFPTRSASVQTINAHLKQVELSGMKPDIVIVDYADIMRDISGVKELRHQLGNIYEDLRGLAGEMDIPIWTASQANRSALEEDVIGAEKIAESYSKVMTADFVVSLSRKIEDKASNTARAHVIKNRFGIDGITYPCSMNTHTGLIAVHRPSSKGGIDTSRKMKSSEDFLKQTARNAYKVLGPNVVFGDEEKTSDKKLTGFE